jgi:hypothetical protein
MSKDGFYFLEYMWFLSSYLDEGIISLAPAITSYSVTHPCTYERMPVRFRARYHAPIRKLLWHFV